jgi:chromosome segregation ATPase
MEHIERPIETDDSLSLELREKELEIQRQHRALASFRSTTNEQAAMIEQLKAEIASYRDSDRGEPTTREQAREIALLRRQIGEYEKNVEERGRLIEEFRRRAIAFQNECVQLRTQLGTASAAAAERLASLDTLHEELERRQEALDVTERAAAERLAMLEASAEMQRMLGARVQSLQSLLASRDAQLAAKERELASLRSGTLGRARLSNAATAANRRVSDEFADLISVARRRFFRS